ncbi:MAG: Crp/Fnr family transcriptional regulator [Chitinophagaceae bacterium]|nr:MAG: Crp/Fnr family transcriptional regulator [Chitinophagaceae bacterium]
MEERSFFLARLQAYGPLSEESRAAMEGCLRLRTYPRNDYFVRAGGRARAVAFVCKGLFSQYFTADDGAVIIKRFFPEGYFCTSFVSLLSGAPSDFSIKALEDSVVLEYDFETFRALTRNHPDIAAIYIRYLEVHWVIEKEPQEIALRHETARSRYLDFCRQFPTLEPRLRQHEIASYLGVTPTQLSRIRATL